MASSTGEPDDTDGMFDDDLDSDLLFGIPEYDVEKEGDKDKTKKKDEDIEIDDIDDEDDENEFSISKIKADVGFIDNEFVGVPKAKPRKKTSLHGEDDDSNSILSLEDVPPVSTADKALARIGSLFTESQKPFQPSSSPVNLQHRFMVWNFIGTIRSYDTEDDSGIDATFHDHSHHQSIHLRNKFGFTMGTMSSEALVFACPKAKDYPSKLFCLNYGSWDSSKEWTIDMQFGEEILAIGVGDNWIAAATDLNRLRMFSLTGVQYFVYEIPGPVVAISGFNSLLFLTYNFGVGTNDCQSIYYSIFKMKTCSLTPLMQHLPIPITPRSMLSWIGFSEEGTPSFCDTSDCLRILNGELWTPFCNMREFLTGPNDHFWVVGLGQVTQIIRAVKCKGAKYPPTLPLPTELLLEAKIPLCGIDNSKGQKEDLMLRSHIMRGITKKMELQGIDMESYQLKARTDLEESTMALVELAVNGNRDSRASEYVALMPTVQKMEEAVKLASRLRKTGLVERLRKIARQKMEHGSDDDDEYDDFENPTIRRTSYVTTGNSNGNGSIARDSFTYEDNRSFHDSYSESRGELSKNTEVAASNPLLQKHKEEIRNLCSSTVRKSNPFKKTVTEEGKKDSQGQDDSEKGFGFIEAWKKPAEKPAEVEFNAKHSRGKGGNRKNKGAEKASKESSAKAPNKKKQPTLFDMNGAKKGKDDSATATTSNNSNPTSPAFDFGSEDNSNLTNSEPFTEPDTEELELEPETSTSREDSNRYSTKRKRDDDEDEEEEEIVLPFSSLTSSTNEKKSKSANTYYDSP